MRYDLEESLRRQAARARPAFSDALHARLMTAVDAAAVAAPARRSAFAPVAAAAAVLLTLGGSAWWTTRVVTPTPAVVRVNEVPDVPAVPALADDVRLPSLERLVEEHRYALLDRDAARLGRFLLDQIPRPPAVR